MSTTAHRPATSAAGLAILALLLAGPGCSCPGRTPPDAAISPEPAAEALAALTLVEGQVTLLRAGQESPAAIGPLQKDDTVATGPASRAVLRFRGGREVEVGAGARFKVGEGPGEVSLEIAEGMVLTRSGGAAGPSGVALTILTPDGLSRVAAGGAASVTVAPGGTTTIEVHTGEITFVGKDGVERKAAGGERVEVALGAVQIVRGTPDAGGEAAPGPVVDLAAFVVTLSADHGQIQVRPAGESRFRPLAKGATAPALEGLAFRVLKGGRGLLAGGGVALRLAGGSEGTVGKAGREGETQRLDVALSRGSTQVLLEGEGRREVRLSGAQGEVVVTSSGDAAVQWTPGTRSSRAEVQAGQVEVRYRDQTQTLGPGEVAEIGKGLSVSRRARPPLVLSAGRRVRVYGYGPAEVGLSWPEQDGARRVEVSRDPDFKDVLLAGAPTGGLVTPAAPVRGELFWRVLGPGAQVLSRGHAAFAPERAVPMMGGHPLNEVAETGLKATVYYQSVLPALVFSFPAIEGAARYRVRVYKANDLKVPLVDRTVAERRCAAEPGALGEGSYLWNATPLAGSGAELAGGRMNKLEIVYDNAMVNLVIERPQPREAVGAQVQAKGIAPLGSRLFLNGRPAPLDKQGRFDLTVPRASLLVFRLVTADQSEAFWVRSLRAR